VWRKNAFKERTTLGWRMQISIAIAVFNAIMADHHDQSNQSIVAASIAFW
jgi:hypothetical protein